MGHQHVMDEVCEMGVAVGTFSTMLLVVLTTSEVQSKMIIMGHQISSCHVLVLRSFFILKKGCYHLKIFHMITFLNILISSSIIPKSDLVMSHNSSPDVPISTSLVPKSHIVMSHNSSCYEPNINFS